MLLSSADKDRASARICDPAAGFDRSCDLAVSGDRIAAVGSGLASHARQVIELDGNLVTAGWVDLHVHVFEWMTTFGLPPDNAGVHSGITTAVDQGGAGAYTILAFKAYIADRALTDIRCFPSINSAGTLRGGLAGPIIHTPEVVDVAPPPPLARTSAASCPRTRSPSQIPPPWSRFRRVRESLAPTCADIVNPVRPWKAAVFRKEEGPAALRLIRPPARRVDPRAAHAAGAITYSVVI
jgi:hypothetical protein